MNNWQVRHDQMHAFATRVDAIVEREYGISDGGDLCYNLVELGRIDMADGEASAARSVAQHLQQA